MSTDGRSNGPVQETKAKPNGAGDSSAKAAGGDSGTPADLMPSNGRFPTEVAYYTSVILTDPGDEDPPKDLATDGPIDLTSDAGAGSTKPAVGVRITTEQAWYAEGVTLGQLLHSISLAPGESTRIAVVDWARRTAGQQKEATGQMEQLAASSDQARALSEVANAVAHEAQHGSSTMHSRSTSHQAGGSSGFFGLFGASGSSGSNIGVATSVSSSSGARDVAAKENQRIRQRTHQHASSARSRRAAVVQETSQSEHEAATTRVLTNYNHMHALTVQYYEAIQIYRVETKPVNYERVLFVPLKPLDGNQEYDYSHLLLMLSRALASYKYEGRPLLSMIDPTPIAITGNYVGFLWPFDESHKKSDQLMMSLPSAMEAPAKIFDSSKCRPLQSRTDGHLSQLNIRIDKSESDPEPHVKIWDIMNNEIMYGFDTSDSINYVVLFPDGGIDLKTIRKIQIHGDGLLHNVYMAIRRANGMGISYTGPGVAVSLRGSYTWATFRPVFTEEEWREQFEHDDPLPLRVPLPSGGVFAEAVLGRANAAEKLDITRFWDWHDSPIPILPPDIQAVHMGSRAQPMNLATHALEAQAARLQKLQAMPDPQGMQAITQTLMANIFRDMSNARETAETARKGLQLSSEGAQAAGKDALETYKAALQHQEAMARMALDAAGMMAAPEAGALGDFGGGGAGGGLGNLTGGGAGVGLGGLADGGTALARANPSRVGAVMNAAQAADRAEAEGTDTGTHTRSALSSMLGNGVEEKGDGEPSIYIYDAPDLEAPSND